MGDGRIALVAPEEEGYPTARERPLLHGASGDIREESG